MAIWFLVPIAVGVVGLITTSCSEDENEDNYGKDVQEDDIIDDAFAGEALNGLADTMKDSFNKMEILDAKNEVKDHLKDTHTETTPQIPTAPEANFLRDMPCGYPASLSFDQKANALLTTCGGAPSALFRSKMGADGFEPWEKVADIAGYPSHHRALGDNFYIVNHSMPDGFSIVDGNSKTVTQQFDLSGITSTYPGGSFSPNNPAGAALVGGNLCIATSNMDHMDMDPVNSTFFPGSIICFPYDGNGTINQESVTSHLTSSKNPTGMVALESSDKIAVLSSGTYVPSWENTAHLNICKVPEMECESFPITTDGGDPITAQISPTLALSSGGKIVFGVQKPGAAIVEMDPGSGNITFYEKIPAVQNFISSIQAYGQIATISDFGVFGESGNVLFKNMTYDGWIDVLETEIPGSMGPSTIIGSKLYQTATDASMMGSVWMMEMDNLK